MGFGLKGLHNWGSKAGEKKSRPQKKKKKTVVEVAETKEKRERGIVTPGGGEG